MTKGSLPEIVDGNHVGKKEAPAKKKQVRKDQDRSFAPVTAEAMRQRMTIRTSRKLQYVLARIGNAAKNNCKRIRCFPNELDPADRAFLADELGYLVTFITEKDKYEVRWAGFVDEEEFVDAPEIDSEFAEGS